MRVIDDGHVYELNNLESEGTQRVVFIKRSSGAITHAFEHAGTNSQELLRVTLDCVDVLENRTVYLHEVKEAIENDDCLHYLAEARENLRKALLCYEARAFRRKQDQVNQTEHAHVSFSERDKDLPFDHLGFKGEEPIGIEHLPVGPDGHIKID